MAEKTTEGSVSAGGDLRDSNVITGDRNRIERRGDDRSQTQRVEFQTAQNVSDIQIAISEIRQGLANDREVRHDMRQQMWRMSQDINGVSRHVEKLLDLERTFDKRMLFFEKHLDEQLRSAYDRTSGHIEKQIRQVYTWMITGWIAMPLLMAFLYWLSVR
ncbi:MAG: hypothetical protein KJZ93_32295 [Caldilineaceae bacterium]|nr:hypothetical protein [Caldilineaceae bacterium]